MEIQILRVDENIHTVTNLRDPVDRGEIAHFVMQLELIKQRLLKMWDKFELDEVTKE